MDRKASTARNDLEQLLVDETGEPKALPLSLLEDITGDFSDDQEIGSGGFAVVYKGILGDRLVAVKKLSDAFMDENKFHREVECLMQVKHKNVVRFLGYCADRQGKMERYDGKLVMADVHQRLLCFEYIPNGSLEKYIIDQHREWGMCYNIIKGICEGLENLHENRIVHLDLKPANIMLDDNMTPKITDFGLSRCFNENQSQDITKNIIGTIGYLAPEFHEGGVIARSADLYSLGVIIIEILTGQKGFQAIEDVLGTWSGRLERSQQEVQCEQIRVCYDTALECREFNPMKRPASARTIIDRLLKAESIQEKNDDKGGIGGHKHKTNPDLDDRGGEMKKNSNKDGGGGEHKKNPHKGGRGIEHKRNYDMGMGWGKQNKNPDKGGGGNEENKNADNGGGGDEQKRKYDKGIGGGIQNKNPSKGGGGNKENKNAYNGGGGGEQKKNPAKSGESEDRKKNPDKGDGDGEQKENPNKHGEDEKDDKAGSQSLPKEDNEKKQPLEMTEPTMYRPMWSVHNVPSSPPREVGAQESIPSPLNHHRTDRKIERRRSKQHKIHKDFIVENLLEREGGKAHGHPPTKFNYTGEVRTPGFYNDDLIAWFDLQKSKVLRDSPSVPAMDLHSTPTEETTVLLKMRLHCDRCAEKIKRRIYKVEGVVGVVVEDIDKHEVKVVGTMDVAGMVMFLKEKLNRSVVAVQLSKKDDKKDNGGQCDGEKKKEKSAVRLDVHKYKDDKKDNGAQCDGEKKKDKSAVTGDVHKDNDKVIEVSGPSMLSAAAPAGAPYGSVAYPQPPNYFHYHQYAGGSYI